MIAEKLIEIGKEINLMTLTEIKKEILKQKPQARLSYIRKGSAYYYADISEKRVYFKIPVSDMGDADFGAVMEAKLLNRWIILPDNNKN